MFIPESNKFDLPEYDDKIPEWCEAPDLIHAKQDCEIISGGELDRRGLRHCISCIFCVHGGFNGIANS